VREPAEGDKIPEESERKEDPFENDSILGSTCRKDATLDHSKCNLIDEKASHQMPSTKRNSKKKLGDKKATIEVPKINFFPQKPEFFSSQKSI